MKSLVPLFVVHFLMSQQQQLWEGEVCFNPAVLILVLNGDTVASAHA